MDRDKEATASPVGTVHFPHLQPVRVHLADLIAASPGLQQAWEAQKLQRSNLLIRLIQNPEQLSPVLDDVHRGVQTQAIEVSIWQCLRFRNVIGHSQAWMMQWGVPLGLEGLL